MDGLPPFFRFDQCCFCYNLWYPMYACSIRRWYVCLLIDNRPLDTHVACARERTKNTTTIATSSVSTTVNSYEQEKHANTHQSAMEGPFIGIIVIWFCSLPWKFFWTFSVHISWYMLATRVDFLLSIVNLANASVKRDAKFTKIKRCFHLDGV